MAADALGADPPPKRPAGMPAIGALLLGKYRVGELVGSGGMGAVIAARHEHLDERIALKLLHSSYARDPEIRKRFKREGPAAFKLKSEHVCRVLDAGELEDGTPFIAMEFLDGRTLSSILADRGRLPIREAIDYALQVCLGLADAHDNGIVHRDLKPSNLILTKRRDGSTCLKVIDFGISKIEGAAPLSTGDVTNTYGFVGSPSYSAPEQLASAKGVTSSADIWGLGVVLYQMIMGRLPFDFTGDSFAIIATTIARAPPVSMTKVDPSVPRELEAVIFRCLEKDPNRRFDTAADVSHALAPFASSPIVAGGGARKHNTPTAPPAPPQRGGVEVRTESVPIADNRTAPLDTIDHDYTEAAPMMPEEMAERARFASSGAQQQAAPTLHSSGSNPALATSAPMRNPVKSTLPLTSPHPPSSDADMTRYSPIEQPMPFAPAAMMMSGGAGGGTTTAKTPAAARASSATTTWLGAAITLIVAILILMFAFVLRKNTPPQTTPVIATTATTSFAVPTATATATVAASVVAVPSATASSTASSTASASAHPTTRPTTTHAPTRQHNTQPAPSDSSSPKILKDWQGKF